jgi:cyanophycinase
MRPSRPTWYRSVSTVYQAFAFSLVCIFWQTALAQHDPTAQEPLRKLGGSLLLHGGGKMDKRVRETFVELAGGPQAKIVIVPSASAEIMPDEELLKNWQDFSVTSLKLLHATSREQADTEEFQTALQEATGVWFNGGDQERLEALYVGTRFEKELLKVIDRGGIVGGSSAGAAIASKVMISRGEQRQGFDLLPESIVDQHFTKRNRESRLLSMLERHPNRIGFGIDEDTALLVRGRRLVVLGSSTVDVYMTSTTREPLYKRSLRHGEVADLIALHRTNLARQAEPFPPPIAPVPNVPQGTLFIVGGGGVPDGLLEQFIEKAGGADAPIVYVPCLEEDDASRDRFDVVLRRAGAKNVVKLHTKDRDKANNDNAFLAPLREAKGIWFGGGRQWNFVDSYQNTQAHQLMLDVLNRGGAIGGSSAGASIQGDYMPRGDPLGNLNIIAPGYERGLGFLCGVGIDQHFAQRNRFEDMTLLIQTYPQLLGIGIDESTAIIVQGHIAEVVGKGNVAFYDSQSTAWISTHQPNAQDSQSDNNSEAREDPSPQDYMSLSAGQRFDLKARKPLPTTP